MLLRLPRWSWVNEASSRRVPLISHVERNSGLPMALVMLSWTTPFCGEPGVSDAASRTLSDSMWLKNECVKHVGYRSVESSGTVVNGKSPRPRRKHCGEPSVLKYRVVPYVVVGSWLAGYGSASNSTRPRAS